MAASYCNAAPLPQTLNMVNLQLILSEGECILLIRFVLTDGNHYFIINLFRFDDGNHYFIINLFRFD